MATAKKNRDGSQKLLREAYIRNRVAGMTPKAAADAAGCKDTPLTYQKLEEHPEVVEALTKYFDNSMAKHELTRDTVIEGFLDAINVARLAGAAGDMIRGWSEIAKMHGMYAPDRKTLEIETGKGTALLQNIDKLSDVELLRLLGRKEGLLIHQVVDEEVVEFE